MSYYNVDGNANKGGSYYPSVYGDIEMGIYRVLRKVSVISTREANRQLPHTGNRWGMIGPLPGFGATNNWGESI